MAGARTVACLQALVRETRVNLPARVLAGTMLRLSLQLTPVTVLPCRPG